MEFKTVEIKASDKPPLDWKCKISTDKEFVICADGKLRIIKVEKKLEAK